MKSEMEKAFASIGEDASLAACDFWRNGPDASWRCEALETENAVENARCCGLDAAGVEAVEKVASQAKESAALGSIAKHLVWTVFVRDGKEPERPAEWPSFKASLGNLGHCLYLLAAVSCVPLLKEWHRKLGVDENTTAATCSKVKSFLETNRRWRFGQEGIQPGSLLWLRNYLFNRYFRLGRFEFWAKSYEGQASVFRNKEDGSLTTFAADGLNFDAAGYALDASAAPPNAVWRSSLSIDEKFATGNPVDASGRTAKETISLPLTRWEPFLIKGSPVLDMHIPDGGGMDLETSLDSFRQAEEFFKRLTPEVESKAIVCHSWIFNPNLPEILPPSANLVKLLKAVQPYPLATSATEGLGFIFHMDKFDLATAPEETSLQRAVLSYVRSGGRWRCGGMFIPLGATRRDASPRDET